ncbi:hypothetical protein E4U53_004796 [Claviceps sorghi]|nr:hypothetical protein E4U53_004796 [Claviceps sorghi]
MPSLAHDQACGRGGDMVPWHAIPLPLPSRGDVIYQKAAVGVSDMLAASFPRSTVHGPRPHERCAHRLRVLHGGHRQPCMHVSRGARGFRASGLQGFKASGPQGSRGTPGGLQGDSRGAPPAARCQIPDAGFQNPNCRFQTPDPGCCCSAPRANKMTASAMNEVRAKTPLRLRGSRALNPKRTELAGARIRRHSIVDERAKLLRRSQSPALLIPVDSNLHATSA